VPVVRSARDRDVTLHGAGDRWLAGDAVDGVAFALHDQVEIVSGANAGERGSIVLLLGLEPAPVYLVRLAATDRHVRVRQPALRAVR
jgi:hypothetical protein